MPLTDEQAKQLSDIFESNVRLETQMYTLVGNGQPGRIGKLEDKTDRVERIVNYLIGVLIFLSAVSGLAVAILK